MKKVLAIIILCLYTLATSGAIVKMHYCGEELESFRISLQEQITFKKSACCEASNDHCSFLETETNCCNDNLISLKLNNDYNYSYFKFLIDGSFVPLYPTDYCFALYNSHYLKEICPCHSNGNSPLGLWQSIPLYLLFHQEKIYDAIV
jgi:hypothetical protein